MEQVAAEFSEDIGNAGSTSGWGKILPPLCDLRSAHAAYEAAAVRVADLLRSLPARDTRTARLEWTVQETAAHLAGAPRLYRDFVTGQRAPWVAEEIAAQNARLLQEFLERQPAALADSLLQDVQMLLDVMASRPETAPVPWYSGQLLSSASMLAILLGGTRDSRPRPGPEYGTGLADRRR